MILRTLCLSAALAAFAGAAAAAPPCEGAPSGVKLNVTVTGAKPAKGLLAITVYDSAKRWLAPGQKLLRQRPKATAGAVQACFWLPKAGTYGVAVYHDINGDKDFNRTLTGMPAEGFGFSNNVAPRFALPKFTDVRFTAGTGETSQRIGLRYLD
ncbi:MAG: DUF2141 domain-containing protein [Caulobacteraceae bacterium]|nr:DUF2141 domain-containing protein [Caulobacteraceae bacterium]